MRSLHNATYTKFIVGVWLLSGCGSEMAQARIAVDASKAMLAQECPRYLAILHPERVERCETRLVVQNTIEVAYNAALAADAIGSGAYKVQIAKLKGLIEGLLQ